MIVEEAEMSGGLPPTVDFRILGRCDLACPFCYGPRHNLRAMETDKALTVLELLRSGGVANVVISGGEPCLVRDLDVLLRRAKALEMSVVLSTNGILFSRRLRDLAPYVQWLGLPLDAVTAETNQVIRPGRADQRKAVAALIPEVRQRFPKMRIKLGTVVCSLNSDEVVSIPKFLGSSRPDVWKLYQVVYSTYGADNRAMVELSDNEFDEIVDVATIAAADWQVPLVVFRRDERPGKYLFIEPNADVKVATIDDEVVIGNLLANYVGVVQKWREFVDLDRLSLNMRDTYFGLGG